MWTSKGTWLVQLLASLLLAASTHNAQAAQPEQPIGKQSPAGSGFVRDVSEQVQSLRLAIEDLIATFGDAYPRGQEYRDRLEAIRQQLPTLGPQEAQRRLDALRDEALLANPLLDFDSLIVLKRRRGQLGLPTNHQCNPSLPQRGYDNEIAIFPLPAGPSPRRGMQPAASKTPQTIFRPQQGFFVGEIDLHFDGDRLLFTMPNGRTWQIWEIRVDGTGLRQVSPEEPDVHNFDACYLPDERIIFASTACFTGVPCWHGRERACSLYLMNADGTGMRQLCFDQDLDLHPAVLPTGQVIYSRWDYTGIMHVYLRPLMVMNPDGTGQRAVYGSNSYYPNSLFFPRGIPNAPGKIVAILSGYHGVNRMGELVVLDISRGWHEAKGILHRIGHRGQPPVPIVRDDLVSATWPKFLHPYPLSDKYFLAAVWPEKAASWGIYLVDVFDNFVPLVVDPQYDFFEPIALRKTPRPPVIPDRVDLARDDAVVYLHNVYAGPGLKGVPQGAVKKLRIAAYHYGYPGMAGPDKIGRAGPWEVMRILGTVPVYEDGSAAFRVPACVPITIQPLDGEGKALALMRSWYTAMPGEVAACVGCHEEPREASPARRDIAALRGPVELQPWYGPPRGFSFQREVQPVLDKYCVGCHNGQPREDGRVLPDLRARGLVPDYEGVPLSDLGAARLHPQLRARTDIFPPHKPNHHLLVDRKIRYTPAYDVLIPLIRRVNVEDYVGLHVPSEYHADTSELVQMLRKGHHGVVLDAESWDRLVTWIDLNGPCYGTWGEVAPIPDAADVRRRQLALKYGGPKDDPEAIPQQPSGGSAPRAGNDGKEGLAAARASSIGASASQAVQSAALADWPLEPASAKRRQQAAGVWEKTVELASGVSLRLVRIPPGEFLMGDASAAPDEGPVARVHIDRPFWISAYEITNQQYRLFEPEHFSGYFMKRSLSVDGPGVDLNQPQQPAVRVSWQQAMGFCRWASARTGLRFSLPTEAQWEYACRAGTAGPFSFGSLEADFGRYANMADLRIGRYYTTTGGIPVLLPIPHDQRCDDGNLATAPVGSYGPNAWGLYDMHGNAAEWTLSTYRPYPYREDDGRNTTDPEGRKVVRGGSFCDRPARCRSSFRLDYPSWQRVHNVGFRVVCED